MPFSQHSVISKLWLILFYFINENWRCYHNKVSTIPDYNKQTMNLWWKVSHNNWARCPRSCHQTTHKSISQSVNPSINQYINYTRRRPYYCKCPLIVPVLTLAGMARLRLPVQTGNGHAQFTATEMLHPLQTEMRKLNPTALQLHRITTWNTCSKSHRVCPTVLLSWTRIKTRTNRTGYSFTRRRM